MALGEIVAMVIVALVVGGMFYYGLKKRGPWGSFWTFLLVVFVGIWLAVVWVDPVGPVWYGAAWFDLFFVGIIFALLLAAATPSATKEQRMHQRSGSDDKEVRKTAISAFFWIMLFFILVAIIIGLAF